MAYARWATIRHLKSESEPPFAARTRLIFAVIGASHRHSTRLMIKLRMHWAGCDESSVGLTRRTDSHSAQTWGYFAMPFTSRQSYGWREYERGGEHACELICRCVLLTANSMTAGAERNEFIVWIKGKRIKQLNSYLFFLFFFECIMFSGDAAQQTGLRIRIIILKVDGIHFEVMANRAGIKNDGGDGFCTVHWWTEGMCGIIQYPLWNTPICNVLCDNDECVPFVQQYNPYVWCPGVLYSMFMLFKIVLWPNFLSQSEIYCYIPLLLAPLTSRCGDGIDTVRGWMENQASFQ